MKESCAELLTKKRYPVRRIFIVLQNRDIVNTFLKGEKKDGIIFQSSSDDLTPETLLHKNSDYFVRSEAVYRFQHGFTELVIRGRLWRETTPAAGDTIPRIIQNICFCVVACRAWSGLKAAPFIL